MKNRPLLLLIAFGFALRLFRLGEQSLWFDEIITVHLAKLPLREGLDGLLAQGIQLTPFFHWLIKGWLAVGDSDWLVRFPAVCFSLLLIPLMYRLGRTYVSAEAGLWAAALATVNPFQVWYAQEVKVYSALVVAAAGAMLAFGQLLRGERKGSGAALGLFHALGVSAHHFMFLVSTVQFVFLALRLKQYYRHLRGWLLAQALAASVLLPWFGYILHRRYFAVGIGWVPRPGAWEPLLTLWNFSVGYREEATAGVILSAGVAALSLLLGVRAMLRRGEWGRFVLLWLFLPLAVVWLFSQGKISFYVDRYFLVIAPALLLTLAAGVANLSTARLRYGLGAALLLAMLYGTGQIFFNPTYFRKDDWRSMARQLTAQAQPGDGLVTCTDGYRLALDYYNLGGVLAGNEPLFLYPVSPNFNRALEPYRRVWVVTSNPRQPQHHLGYSYRRSPELARLLSAERAWATANAPQVIAEAGITAYAYPHPSPSPPPDWNRLIEWLCNR